MKTPADWIVIDKRRLPDIEEGAITELVPTNAITKLTVFTKGDLICDIAIDTVGRIFSLPSNLYQEAAESLGILEVLGQKTPGDPCPSIPAHEKTLIEDGRRYRVLRRVLEKYQFLSIRKPEHGPLEIWVAHRSDQLAPSDRLALGDDLDDALRQIVITGH